MLASSYFDSFLLIDVTFDALDFLPPVFLFQTFLAIDISLSTQEEKIDSSLEFLILASDGLWDVVSNEVCHLDHPSFSVTSFLKPLHRVDVAYQNSKVNIFLDLDLLSYCRITTF